jgi:hypothetical protein
LPFNGYYYTVAAEEMPSLWPRSRLAARTACLGPFIEVKAKVCRKTAVVVLPSRYACDEDVEECGSEEALSFEGLVA